jgi:hypothetical protein
MKDYFKTKLGKKLSYSVTSGNTFFTEIYQKRYSLEVIKVTSKSVTFEITSNDHVPAGWCKAGTFKNYGLVEIKFYNKNKLQIIYDALVKVDLHYFLKYSLNEKAIA